MGYVKGFERVYLGIYYLKILHYFFFSLAVFTLTSGIFFWEFFTIESLNLLAICAVYSFFSLYIAHCMYKSYTQLAEPLMVIRNYVLPYPLLSFWTCVLTFFLVYVSPYLTDIVYAFLFVNYYIVFFLFIGLFMSRLKFVGKLFEVYDNLGLRRAKSLASRYSHIAEVDSYRVGSDPKTDEMLDDIWNHRNYPLPYVKELETRLCEMQMYKIERSIKALERIPERTKTEEELLGRLKTEMAEYLRKIERVHEFGD
jgi:hypothetical protein